MNGAAMRGVGPSPAGRVRRAAGAALPIALAAAAAAGAVVLLARPAAWTAIAVPAGLGLAAVAWLRPVLAVAVLLALAPICGTRPTTGPFLALAGLTACAVPGWLAGLATRDRLRLLERLGTPLGLALCAYGGTSLLSLSSLPIYAPADIVGASTLVEAIRVLPSAFAGADVTSTIYPVLTVVLTLHALLAALVVGVAVRQDPETRTAATPSPGALPAVGVEAATLVAGSILAGLVLTIALGTLDRLGWFDLRLLRDVDPFTNPSGAERLQSTFGHAGWFAQYICFATPTVLVLWLWPPPGAAESRGRRALRVAAAALLLAVSLAVIVLSYQRGGWITWAVVGSGVAAVVVRLAAADGGGRGVAPSARWLIPIAVVVLAAAVLAGIGVVRIAGGPGALDRFASRARTIGQVSDREAHVVAGVRIGALQPILGAGSESFAIRYEEEYLRAGGHYYARGYSPVLGMYGSAHNVFAQTFAGKGAVGLIALILVVLTAAAAALRAARQASAPAWPRVVAAIALGIVAAFTLYGQVQEVFYMPALQLTVFAAFGLALALEPAAPGSRPTARLGVVTGLLALALAAHLVHGYVFPGFLAEGYRDREITLAGERLSAPVLGDDGEYFQWTGARAVITVPRQATELSFDLRRPGEAPREVEVWLDARLVDRLRLDDGNWRHAVYPLQRMRILPRRLDIVVRPVASDRGGRADAGVAVRRIRWGMETPDAATRP
jgi:O-antigen ligase